MMETSLQTKEEVMSPECGDVENSQIQKSGVWRFLKIYLHGVAVFEFRSVKYAPKSVHSFLRLLVRHSLLVGR